MVTRAAGAGEAFAARLRELGAEPLLCPLIAIAPVDDTGALDAALGGIGRFAWVVFTSGNAVEAVRERLAACGGTLAGVRVAAVGPGTAAALAACGLTPAFVAGVHTAEALAAELPIVAGERVLIPAADIARPTLAEGLRARGALVEVVTAYRTVETAPEAGAVVIAALREGSIDALTFTSPSTVRGFVALLADLDLDALARRPAVVCIGPVTAAAAQECGLSVDAVAREHTIAGLGGALVDCLSLPHPRRSRGTPSPARRGESAGEDEG